MIMQQLKMTLAIHYHKLQSNDSIPFHYLLHLGRWGPGLEGGQLSLSGGEESIATEGGEQLQTPLEQCGEPMQTQSSSIAELLLGGSPPRIQQQLE